MVDVPDRCTTEGLPDPGVRRDVAVALARRCGLELDDAGVLPGLLDPAIGILYRVIPGGRARVGLSRAERDLLRPAPPRPGRLLSEEAEVLEEVLRTSAE